MVGSVLRERMAAEDDLARFEPRYFSTSGAGQPGPDGAPLADAHDLAQLAAMQVIVTCQGSAYTNATHAALRSAGWRGYWVDAASALRDHEEATLVLDPVNGAAVREALHAGCRTFVGANCTVSLMLMGLVGLIRTGEVRWISTMSYQSASGAGARHVRELVAQMRHLGDAAAPLLDDPAAASLAIDRTIRDALSSPALPTTHFGAPLAGSAIPWIDRHVGDGQTREEQKSGVEANALLGTTDAPLPIDGLCVRIGAMRSHAQALTIQLRRPMPIDDITASVSAAHDWVQVVPNQLDATRQQLTPAAVAGTLNVRVGRIRALRLAPNMVACFTVGDQLLWGAAEPLRRMLHIIWEIRTAA